MSEESHIIPLAPPQMYERSDEYWGPNTKPKDINHKQRSSSKCFVYILLLLVLQSIALLIFASVVLRTKAPKLKIELVHIQNLKYTTSDLASLNMTLVAQVQIHNENFGRFKYKNGSASLLYGNTTLGMTNIESGLLGGREIKRTSVSVRAKVDSHLAENMNFSREIESGLVKLNSYAKLRGEIRVVKFLTRRRTSFMNCSMGLNLTSQVVQDLRCI